MIGTAEAKLTEALLAQLPGEVNDVQLPDRDYAAPARMMIASLLHSNYLLALIAVRLQTLLDRETYLVRDISPKE